MASFPLRDDGDITGLDLGYTGGTGDTDLVPEILALLVDVIGSLLVLSLCSNVAEINGKYLQTTSPNSFFVCTWALFL